MIDTTSGPSVPVTAETSLPYLEEESKRRETKVDKLNENLAKTAYDDSKATHVKSLHPTKGFRKISLKRLLLNGDVYHRMNVFYTTIAKAAKAKAASEGKTVPDGQD